MIFIPGHVPSSKNSKQWTGKMLISNKPTLKYKANTIWHYARYKNDFLAAIKNKDLPIHLGFYFLRESRHDFDFINACQIVQDSLVKADWLADDNMKFLIPYCLHTTNLHYSYNKETPGVILKVLDPLNLDLLVSLPAMESLINQVLQK